MRLDTPIDHIKGVGETLASKFAQVGVKTVQDLLRYYPRRYEDYSRVRLIEDIEPGKVTIKGVVQSSVGRYVARRLHVTEVVVADESSKLRIVWYNQPYRAKQFVSGQEYFFSGKYEMQRNRFVLSNPSAEKADAFGVSTARIVPIYPEIAGLKSRQIGKVVKELIPIMTMLPESLPESTVSKNKLMALGETLINIHFPKSTAALDQAKERIAFEELLWLMLASELSKEQLQENAAHRIKFDAGLARRFTEHLPFELTPAQKVVAMEIFKDVDRPSPMNRLLQGDVGSGKTIVAAFAAYMTAKSGLQTAFMAPTEVLAAQHANVLDSVLAGFGIKTSLLVGSIKSKAKQELKQRIKSGDIDVVVGTQALIQSDVDFHKLGLVVVDEQHRFGVDQRRKLLSIGRKQPHMLSMTATPIPRSLQLTVYGDLDVSLLRQMPKGRRPIITRVVNATERNKIYEDIDAQIAEGRQVYIICPLVNDMEIDGSEIKSVNSELERLKKTIFSHRRIAALHGQMKSEEKEKVMSRFKASEFDILVSTTVVEVGVDNPNATIILIEGAEKFGLAQLHQLRGRVGRGEYQSYCYLLPTDTTVSSRRLAEMKNSNDGFYLAEVDLQMRGPGEIYGKSQHGKLDLNFVDLANLQLIKKVQQTARQLVKDKLDLLQYPQLKENIDKYSRLTKLN